MKTENLTYSLSNKTSFKKNAQEIKKRENENPLVAESRVNTSVRTAKKYDRVELNKQDIKATAGKNPSGRLSFKGKKEIAEMTVEQLSKTFGGKLATSKTFNKFLDIITKNSLLADALIALGFTAVLRPATIYAIPSKDKETRKKNNYQVAHSVATGLLGLGTTLAVSTPISRGIAKLLEHPENYLNKGVLKITKDNKEAIKQTANRFHQPIFLPVRAILTIMLVPPILKMLGLSKASKTPNLSPSDKAKIDYSFMSFKGSDKKMFKNFVSINSSFEKAEKNLKKENASKSKPSFKGIPFNKLGKEAAKVIDKTGNTVTENIAKGVGKIIDTEKFQKFINWFSGTNYIPHLIAGESAILSSFYMIQSGRSNKIEKDQKLPMILNQGITALVCGAAAYTVDNMVFGSLKKYQEVYKKLNPTMDMKLLENRTKAIKMLGPLVIFTALYRFIGPVVVTPVANWLSEKIQPHKKAPKA